MMIRATSNFSVLEEVEAEDGSSRAHAACFEALINAGADVDQWDGEGLAPIHHAAKNGDASCVRFLWFVFRVLFSFFASRVSRPARRCSRLVRLAPAAALACVGSRRWRTGGTDDAHRITTTVRHRRARGNSTPRHSTGPHRSGRGRRPVRLRRAESAALTSSRGVLR